MIRLSVAVSSLSPCLLLVTITFKLSGRSYFKASEIAMREGEGGRGGGKVCVVWCLDDKYRWYLYQLHCWLQCSSAHVPRFTLINDIKCWRNLNYTFRNIYFGRQEAGYWEKSLELWLVRYYAILHLTLHITYRQLSLTMMMTASLEISALIAGLQVRRGWCQPGRLCTVNHWEPWATLSSST